MGIQSNHLHHPLVLRENLKTCQTQEQEMDVIREAMQQWVNQRTPIGTQPTKVVLQPAQSCLYPHYQFARNTMTLQYLPGLAPEHYLHTVAHEHEHAKQNYNIGYNVVEQTMVRISLALYPDKVFKKPGVCNAAYSWNYLELKATLGEAQFLHNHYLERLGAKPPNFMLKEKEALLEEMKIMEKWLKQVKKFGEAKNINSENRTRIFWGKYNAAHVAMLSKGAMRRFLKNEGRDLLKQLSADLQNIHKQLKKDIAEIEREASPLHRAQTIKREQQALADYAIEERGLLRQQAQSKGYVFTAEFPTDGAYVVHDLSTAEAMDFFMDTRNVTDITSTLTEYAGKFQVIPREGGYYIFRPKALIDNEIAGQMIVDRLRQNQEATHDSQLESGLSDNRDTAELDEEELDDI